MILLLYLSIPIGSISYSNYHDFIVVFINSDRNWSYGNEWGLQRLLHTSMMYEVLPSQSKYLVQGTIVWSCKPSDSTWYALGTARATWTDRRCSDPRSSPYCTDGKPRLPIPASWRHVRQRNLQFFFILRVARQGNIDRPIDCSRHGLASATLYLLLLQPEKIIRESGEMLPKL
jgi:hypothetical protein